jgi:hypothetical protein
MASDTYCPSCGQETSLALPTVRAMLREAAGRYVALDGRMWRTLAGLLFRPGFLTREYLAGRRRRYIRPTRLFLVLSIALFALLRFGSAPRIDLEQDLTQAEREEIAQEMADSEGQKGFSVGPDLALRMNLGSGAWLEALQQRIDVFNRLSRAERGEQIFAGALRYGPYAAFALLPLFALLMKLVYLGRGRRHPLRPRRYAAHLVFGAHNHAFVFLVCAPIALIPITAVRGALIVWAIAYLPWSMKTVYGGRWSGVLARALVVFLLYEVFFAFAAAGLVVAAILLR